MGSRSSRNFPSVFNYLRFFCLSNSRTKEKPQPTINHSSTAGFGVLAFGGESKSSRELPGRRARLERWFIGLFASRVIRARSEFLWGQTSLNRAYCMFNLSVSQWYCFAPRAGRPLLGAWLAYCFSVRDFCFELLVNLYGVSQPLLQTPHLKLASDCRHTRLRAGKPEPDR